MKIKLQITTHPKIHEKQHLRTKVTFIKKSILKNPGEVPIKIEPQFPQVFLTHTNLSDPQSQKEKFKGKLKMNQNT